MLRQNRVPSTTPAAVPAAPIITPSRKKILSIALREAPMVRRMAMSRPLFFTSMTRPEMMFRVVIATSIIRISLIAVDST